MQEYKYFNKIYDIINKYKIDPQDIYLIYNNIIINSYLFRADNSVWPPYENAIYINKKTSFYYQAKKNEIFLNDNKIFLSVEYRIQTKKDTIHKIVKRGLYIYNMSIYYILAKNKIL